MGSTSSKSKAMNEEGLWLEKIFKIQKEIEIVQNYGQPNDHTKLSRINQSFLDKLFEIDKGYYVTPNYPLHEKVIDLTSEINDDYQKLKGVIHSLQENSNKFKLDTSKQRLFDIYTAYKALSYRDAIEKNRASLIRSNEHDGDYIPDGVTDFEKVSELSQVTPMFRR